MFSHEVLRNERLQVLASTDLTFGDVLLKHAAGDPRGVGRRAAEAALIGDKQRGRHTRVCDV